VNKDDYKMCDCTYCIASVSVSVAAAGVSFCSEPDDHRAAPAASGPDAAHQPLTTSDVAVATKTDAEPAKVDVCIGFNTLTEERRIGRILLRFRRCVEGCGGLS